MAGYRKPRFPAGCGGLCFGCSEASGTLCVLEIAYKRGFISREQLLKLAEPLMKTNYGKYMKDVADGL